MGVITKGVESASPTRVLCIALLDSGFVYFGIGGHQSWESFHKSEMGNGKCEMGLDLDRTRYMSHDAIPLP